MTTHQGSLPVQMSNQGSPEIVANNSKVLAMKQMKSKDYQGAWQLLDQAKKLFPALDNVDSMLFVCNLLRTADNAKPEFGVNWLQMLSLPPSAPMPSIEAKFKSFITNLGAIKSEFPGTDIAQGLMKTAMRDIQKREENRLHPSFHTVSRRIESHDHAAETTTCVELKRRLPIAECSSRKVSSSFSSVEPAKTRGNVEVDPKKSVPGTKCQDVSKNVVPVIGRKGEESSENVKMVKSDNQTSDTNVSDNKTVIRSCPSAENFEPRGIVGVDSEKKLGPNRESEDVEIQSKLSKNEVSDNTKKTEKEFNDQAKMVESDNQSSDTAGSKLVVKEIDNEGSQCESNNNVPGRYQLTNSERHVPKTPTYNGLSNDCSTPPDLKINLFESMPQSPHYSNLNGMSEEFRHPIIMAIETSFAVVAQQIRCLFVTKDGKCSEDNISNQLIYLESMGYNVQKLRDRLKELSQLAEMKQVLREVCQTSDKELKAWMVQREASECKNCMNKLLIAEQRRQLRRLEESFAFKNHVIRFQKAREAAMEHKRIKLQEECVRVDSEIEKIAKLPW